jgi:hypothetical protein
MRALSAVAVLIALAWATEAHAYCLSTTCKDTDACEGEEVPGCSVLKWKSRCVGYSIHEAGGPGVNSEALDNIVMLATRLAQRRLRKPASSRTGFVGAAPGTTSTRARRRRVLQRNGYEAVHTFA